jgi:aspartokinase/homoserine dehydrogenase 1
MPKIKTRPRHRINKAKQDKLIVVVSALAKWLIYMLASWKAASNDETYKEIVADIEKNI